MRKHMHNITRNVIHTQCLWQQRLSCRVQHPSLLCRHATTPHPPLHCTASHPGDTLPAA